MLRKSALRPAFMAPLTQLASISVSGNKSATLVASAPVVGMSSIYIYMSSSSVALAAALGTSSSSCRVESTRAHSTHRPFNIEESSHKRMHTYKQLSPNSSTRFGGRMKRFRQSTPAKGKHPGHIVQLQKFKRQPKLIQYNVDVWWAQETLRREWKGREFDVYEVPYSHLSEAAGTNNSNSSGGNNNSSSSTPSSSQHTLQRVIPAQYTEPVFLSADNVDGTNKNNATSNGAGAGDAADAKKMKDTRNLSHRTFPVEELQNLLFNGDNPYPPPLQRQQHQQQQQQGEGAGQGLGSGSSVSLQLDDFFGGNQYDITVRAKVAGKYGTD